MVSHSFNIIASPLDQFGSDSFILGDLFDFLFCRFLLSLDSLLLINEVLDVDFLQGILSSFFSIYFYDDDDCDSSQWDENDMQTSSIQSSIFVSNVLGMLPGMETLTSDPSVTFFYSFSTMITIILIGFSLHGIRFFAILFPAGTPIIMAPFIILIEAVSYLARPISLGMRLFANMFAGHSLLKILMSFAWLFLTSSLPIISIPVFVLLIVIFMMELGIAYLQSYVFGALATMYFEDAISPSH